ncbi:MAG: DUF167 domain-containing protein [Candidatus Kaiserbacteria bacterium]|nr:DUF167 domain-containing protein [Candidatus Kaiserbacteria bacterium]MCB9815986.1 DUF167 domain-containing protein [Candidatus Nomurabacteria bacterium]
MYIRVRVKAGARKESVSRVSETEFHMSVREPAERNMANKRVRELLAGAVGARPEDVKIITGHHSPTKIFDVPE